MRWLSVLAIVSLALPLFGQEAADVRKLTARLAEEADAFQRQAAEVFSEETLLQRAQKAGPRLGFRVGDAARAAPKPVFQQRALVSEYAFTIYGNSLHELRQVVSVDGKKVAERKQAVEDLARIITANQQARMTELLKQFERYGLIGAATDFGQLILLFTPREIEHYEFTRKGIAMLDGTGVYVYNYKQIDGDEKLTHVQAGKRDEVTRLPVEGEIWARADNFSPVRITMVANRKITDRKTGNITMREEAEVNYAMSQFGIILPTSIQHRELKSGQLVAENDFRYQEFHKFAASSEIKFEVEPDPPDTPAPTKK